VDKIKKPLTVKDLIEDGTLPEEDHGEPPF
jgi:hypothetical protein